MTTLNIAGYKFIKLNQLSILKNSLSDLCIKLNLKGTILLSTEGTNINLSGAKNNIESFLEALPKLDPRLQSMHFHQTISQSLIYKRMKVKIKKEIITFLNEQIVDNQAPYLTPHQLKNWIDEKKDFILLDSRNDYEVKFGTFTNAIHLNIKDFKQFAKESSQLSNEKPIVMFCTGGIRCEKAALFMQEQGYKEIYQLQGGILGYFKEVGKEHFAGECFVFDERTSLNPLLCEGNLNQCKVCQNPIAKGEICCSKM